MSNRLAVFNRGLIEQVGTPGRCLRAPGHDVRRRLRRDLEPAQGDAAQGGRSARTASSPSDPRRSGSRSLPTTRSPTSIRPSATCAKSSTSAPTRDISFRSTPVASLSSPSRTCRRHPWRRSPRRAGPSGSIWKRHHVLSLAVSQEAAGDQEGVEANEAIAHTCPGHRARAARWPPAGSPAPSGMLEELGEGEGELNLVIWAGYAEDGSADPGVRLGDAVRGGDRLHRQLDGHGRLRHRRPAAPVGRVRRRLVLRQRHRPAHGGRRRRAGERRAAPELRERLRGPEAPGPQLAGRGAVRRAPRPRPEPPGLEHRGGRAADDPGRPVGGRRRLRGSAQHLRLAGLHRRCGAPHHGVQTTTWASRTRIS